MHAILSLNMPGLLWATAECGWCLMKPISQILQCTRRQKKRDGEALLRVLMAEANRLGTEDNVEVRDSNTAARICENWACQRGKA